MSKMLNYQQCNHCPYKTTMRSSDKDPVHKGKIQSIKHHWSLVFETVNIFPLRHTFTQTCLNVYKMVDFHIQKLPENITGKIRYLNIIA